MGVGGDDSAGKPVRALLAVDSTGYVMLFHRVSPRQISPPSEKAGGQERTSLACRRTTRGAEAAPHAAPSASGKLTKGTCRPHPAICPDSAALGCSDPQHDCRRPVLCTGAKSAKALQEVCFDVKGVMSWPTAVLAYAMMVIGLDRAASELEGWADKVLAQAPNYLALAAEWRPPDEPGWRPVRTTQPTIFEPLRTACTEVIWPNEHLDAMSAAIQRWAGPWRGQHDSLSKDSLRRLQKEDGPKNKKGKTRKLFESAAVPVAWLVKYYRGELRRALNSDEPPPPTKEEQIEALTAERDEQQEQLEAEEQRREAAEKARGKAEAARRMEKGRRLKQKKEMKAWKATQKSLLKERLAGAVARRKEVVERRETARLERANERRFAEQAELLERRARELSKARARAREAEADAEKSQKRLRRAQRAEAALKRAREELDELMEEHAPPLDSDEDSDEEEPAKRGRRDKRGRFEAESWRLRWLRWSQICRRVPTLAISANINEVLSVYAPEVVAPQPTERATRAMRVEATIGGEAINAWRFAKARRIISFGEDETTKWGKAIITTNTQIEPHDAPGTSVDIVLRGGTLTAGASRHAPACWGSAGRSSRRAGARRPTRASAASHTSQSCWAMRSCRTRRPIGG